MVIYLREKDKVKKTKTEIILAQNDDGPSKWANDPYIQFKVMQISEF